MYAEFAPNPLHVGDLTLVAKLELRAITNSQRMRESAVMISSAMPSAK